MKKFFKTSFLVLVAAMLFAACKQPDEGPASNIPIDEADYTSGEWLTDGTWHLDSSSTSKVSMMGQSNEQTVSMHIEMDVEGDKVTVKRATYTVDGVEEDITNDLKNQITTKQEAANSGTETKVDDTTANGIDFSYITPEIKYFKSDDGTEYRVTAKLNTNFADLMREMYEAMGQPVDEAEIAGMQNMKIETSTEAIYKKQ